MKKVIVGISAAAVVIGSFFYFVWYRHSHDAIQ